MSRGLVLFGTMLYFLIPIHGQQDPFAAPRRITKAEGLPGLPVTAIAQDRKGFMWFGTRQGAARFDGQRMITFAFDESDSTSLSSNVVTRILPDGEGAVWICTDRGLNRFDPATATFRRYLASPQDTLFDLPPRVNALLVDRGGTLWLGLSEQGLGTLDPRTGRFQPLATTGEPADSSRHLQPIRNVLDIIQDRLEDGVIWVATTAGLYRVHTESGVWQRFDFHHPDTAFQNRFNAFRTLHQHADGRIFTGSEGGAGIFHPETGRFQPLIPDVGDRPRELSHHPVNRILAGPSGEIWITYSTAFVAYDPDRDAVTSLRYNRPADEAYFGADLIDEAGRIWLGSNVGVHWFASQTSPFSSFALPRNDGQVPGIARAVEAGVDGRRLYVAVQDGAGVYVLDRYRQSWTILRPPSASPGFQGNDLLRLRDGGLLVLAHDRLYRLDEDRLRLQPISHIRFPAGVNGLQRMTQDIQGKLWIGSRRDGLFRVDLRQDSVTHFREELELIPGDRRFTGIEHLLADSHGNVWIRTAHGYSVYDLHRDRFTHHPAWSGQERQPLPLVHNFLEDPSGRIWVAGDQDGLAELNYGFPERGLLSRYRQARGAPARAILRVTSDKQGRIWMDHRGGLARFDPTQGQFQQFGAGSGCPPSSHELFACLPNGELVLGTDQGICLFRPEALRRKREAAKPYVLGLTANGQPLRITSAGAGKNRQVRLDQQPQTLALEFSALAYHMPEQVTYAYQLEGVDPDWVAIGRRTAVTYAHLPGGAYRFRLRAANSEGVWTEIAQPVDIHIPTPWWGRQWIKALAMLLVLSGMGYAIWSRRAWHRQSREVAHAFERRLAEVQRQALQAQMNPHFLFSSLSSIEYYIIRHDTAKASDYLTRFAGLMRKILRHAQMPYVNLQDELEALQRYLEMESLRSERHIQYEVLVDKNLRVQDIDLPPMLLQPYVENAIWHGLMQKKDGQAKLSLVLTQDNGNLKCIIVDNGIGRRAARSLRPTGRLGRLPAGMRITEERLHKINRLYAKRVRVQVTDLHDAEGNPKGTRVELDIPL